MARRPKEKVAISLFPFLSILACVIGTLTLMITALALGQMDNDTVADAEKYQKVKDQLAKDIELIKRLKAEIEKIEAQANDAQIELAELRLKLDELRRRKEALLEKPEEEEPEEIVIPDFNPAQAKQRIKELETEIADLDETKKELLAELKKRGEPPKEAEVVIQPGGSGYNLDPTFVECTSSGIVIYEGDDPPRVRRADLATDETFLGLLTRVGAKRNGTVVFLVRDNALGTYYAARDVANLQGTRNGKLPVIGQGKIDLSLFEK